MISILTALAVAALIGHYGFRNTIKGTVKLVLATIGVVIVLAVAYNVTAGYNQAEVKAQQSAVKK